MEPGSKHQMGKVQRIMQKIMKIKVDKNKNVSNDLPDDEDKTDDTSNDMTESDNPLGDEQA